MRAPFIHAVHGNYDSKSQRHISAMVIPSIRNEGELSGVLDCHDTVVIDFWAKWCRPCLGFLPILETAADRHPDIHFCRVDAGEAKDLLQAFEIESIPTLVVVRDRVMIASQAGLLPEDVLEDLIQKVKALDMQEVLRDIYTKGQSRP